MALTLLFYFILSLCCLLKDKGKAIFFTAVFIALYLGLRYDYMYDYKSYYEFFNEAWLLPYESTSHMEKGWYYLNKLFHPFGFFGFVFFTSCVFAYGVYLVLKDFAKRNYLLFAILGFVTTSSFSVLSSAQRQMFVTGLFFIALHFLLKGRINTFLDLVKPRTILYFAVIYACSFFHGSSFFLFIVPFLYLIPRRSFLIVFLLAGILTFEMVYENTLSMFFFQVVEESGTYDYLTNVNQDFAKVSILGKIMYAIQFAIIIGVYYWCDLDKEQQFCLLLYALAILLFASINFSFQIFRLALYINIFTYISIGVFLSSIKNPLIKKGVGLLFFLWCVDNALFILSIKPGSVEEYKTIFSTLF